MGDRGAQIAILKRVFDRLDSNHDGVLQLHEVDAAVIDPSLQGELSAGIAILKAGFAYIRDLHRKWWFIRKTGITRADLTVFEKLLSAERTSAPTKEAHRELLHLTEVVSQRAREAASVPKRLFKNEYSPLSSVKPEAIKQGIVGDCYFLAAMGSVAATNPQILARSITRLSADSFQVSFAGAPQERYIVQVPTVMELSLYAQITQYGVWPGVLEKAYGQYLIAHGFRQTLVPTDATSSAEKVYEAFDLLTGQMGRWQLISLSTDEELERLIRAACRERRAMAATSNPAPRGDKDRTIDGIPAQHAYSILDWDSNKKRLTVRNPWGVAEHGVFERAHYIADRVPFNNKASKKGKKNVLRRNTVKNRLNDDEGVFAMNLSQMRRNFLAIYFEDWLPDSRFH